LDRIRHEGYAVNRDQFRPEVCAVAAPVLAADGTPIAAVAISMPDSRFAPDKVPHWGELVAQTAAEISSRHEG
jgi:IclR family acetate operon transcriptional repressor